MDGDQIVTEVIRDGALVLLRVDVKHDAEAEALSSPHIYVSGYSTFIADITEENEWIGYSASLRFRGSRTNMGRLISEPLGGRSPRARFRAMRENGDADQVHTLWQWLYRELSDAANPRRFKIPYAFAFELTTEDHDLLQVWPGEILDIIQGKNPILTWITPEIQWGEKLRIRFLRDYIKILRENGFVDWAETIEKLEGKNYLDGEVN